MKCENCREVLSDYLDGTVSQETHESVRQHVQECALCRDQEAELRWIQGNARSLETLPARMENWTAIQLHMQTEGLLPKKIGGGEVDCRTSPEYWRKQMYFYRRLAFAAMAACFILLGFGIGSFWMYQYQPLSSGVQVRQMETQLAVLQLEKAISRLTPILERTKTEWRPEIRKIVDTNLEALNLAIAESERALAKDPNNEEAANFLVQACQRKLAVMNSFLDMNGI